MSNLDQLREFLSSIGYLGFDKAGNYRTKYLKTKSATSILASLKLPQCLPDELAIYRDYWKMAKKDVLQEMANMEYVAEDITTDDEVVKTANGEIRSAINENLQVYLTPNAAATRTNTAKNSPHPDLFVVNDKTGMPIYSDQVSYRRICQMKGLPTEPEELASLDNIWPVFNPYSIEKVSMKYVEVLGSDITCYNLYVAPEWRKVKAKPKYEGFIKRYLETLFPIPHEREWVLRWMKQSIIGRNETVLVLIGDRGIGKSVFNSLMTALHGLRYSEILTKDILTEKFNKQIFNKRFGAFEETGVNDGDGTAIEKMKAMCNARLKIEGKGEESFSAENYCSFTMALNMTSSLGVKPQERRFSIPKVTDEIRNLNEVFPEIEIVKRVEAWLSDNMSKDILLELAEFGEWLLKLDAGDFHPSLPLRGDYYYEITSKYLSEWENAIILACINWGYSGEPIPLKKIKSLMPEGMGRMFPYRDNTISGFLSDYRHKNKCKVGKVVKLNSSGGKGPATAILPDKDFIELFSIKPKAEELL